MQVRKGESDKTWFRNERFLWTEKGWFFLTRESTQEGPYRTKDEAERELLYYIRQMEQWGDMVKTGTHQGIYLTVS